MSISNVNHKGLGGIIKPGEVKLVNRKGSALAVGEVCADNSDFVATHVGLNRAVNTDDASGYYKGCALAVTTSNARLRTYVTKDTSVADNAEGQFYAAGEQIYAYVRGTTATGSAKGEHLVAADGKVYFTTLDATGLAGVASSVRVVGLLLETVAADTTSLVKIEFWGGDITAGSPSTT